MSERRPDPAPAGPLAAPAAWNLVADAYSAELLEAFETYSEAALSLAGVSSETRVLDVATGPGTLALLAAERGATVSALDFSDNMLANLRTRARQRGLSLHVSRGDGQRLPYGDERFDAAFSMFGLMFFPDKARGFRELHRVLRPGGKAVVSSWAELPRAFAAVFRSLSEVVPGIPFSDGKGPLGTVEELISVASDAGFRDVQVETVAYTHSVESASHLWAQSQRTNAPIVLLQQKHGDAWEPISRRIGERLNDTLGTRPFEVTMTALCAVGTRS